MLRIQHGNGSGKPVVCEVTLHGSIADSHSISSHEGVQLLKFGNEFAASMLKWRANSQLCVRTNSLRDRPASSTRDLVVSVWYVAV
jgi:hypothetical protein